MQFTVTYEIKEFDEEKDGKKTGKKIPYKQLYLDVNGGLVPIKILYQKNSGIKNLLVAMIDSDNRYQAQQQANYGCDQPVYDEGPDPSELNPFENPNERNRH